MGLTVEMWAGENQIKPTDRVKVSPVVSQWRLRLHWPPAEGLPEGTCRLEVQTTGFKVLAVEQARISPAFSLTTSAGEEQPPPQKGAPVTAGWAVADWGYPVRLKQLVVHGGKRQSFRLSVAAGEAWYPPASPRQYVTGEPIDLPDVQASRLMVEFLAKEGQPTDGLFETVEIQALAMPPSVRMGLKGKPAFFDSSGPLPMVGPEEVAAGSIEPLEALEVAGLTEALQADTAEKRLQGGVLEIPIWVEADTVGEVVWCHQSVEATLHVEPLSPQKPLGVPQAGGVELPLGPLWGQWPLSALQFRMEVQVANRWIHPEGPLALSERRALVSQFCGAGSHSAQSFSPLPHQAALQGIALWVQPLAKTVEGVVEVHLDNGQQPSQNPCPNSQVPFVWEQTGEGPWKPQWLPLSWEAPMEVGESPWWLVLTLSTGELLWFLQPAPAKAPLGVYHLGDSGWVPHKREDRVKEPTQASHPWWGVTRVQVTPLAPPTVPMVQVGRGTRRLTLQANEQGLFRPTAEEIACLREDPIPESGPPGVWLELAEEGDRALEHWQVTELKLQV